MRPDAESAGHKVFVAQPFFQHFIGECEGNTEGCCTLPNQYLLKQRGEAYVEKNFSELWREALNSREEAGWDRYAMVHTDVQPYARRYLDLMLLEQDRTGADLLSVVLPLKHPAGLTSTAVMNEGGRVRRLTMTEVDRIPDMTFDAAGAGFPGCRLLNSTGLWVCDFTKPWVEEVWFETRCRIVRLASGKFSVVHFPEDWGFSLMLHERGLKVMATKLVSALHWGMSPHPNDRPWGTVKHDDWHDDYQHFPKEEKEPCPP